MRYHGVLGFFFYLVPILSKEETDSVLFVRIVRDKSDRTRQVRCYDDGVYECFNLIYFFTPPRNNTVFVLGKLSTPLLPLGKVTTFNDPPEKMF